tara:strand:+ start:1148 stop:1384 length:237 start_codon:yes stop_codon:yes gene_type:complete
MILLHCDGPADEFIKLFDGEVGEFIERGEVEHYEGLGYAVTVHHTYTMYTLKKVNPITTGEDWPSGLPIEIDMVREDD